MSGQATTLPAVIVAIALFSSSLLSTPAYAGTQCKATSVSATTSNSGLLGAAWSKSVKSTYGAAWSNFNWAKDKNYSSLNLIFLTYYTVTARPCRKS